MSTSTIRRTIVVGAGSSGAVVAARLSEDPSEHVVLIEAGPKYLSVDELPESLWDAEGPALEGSPDWGYKCYWTEPMHSSVVGNYPRGKVLGGSGSINAAMAIRGLPSDFDDWEERGNKGWGWDSVLPYFKKLESDQDFPDRDYHGATGPIPVRRPTVDEWPTAVQSVIEAIAARGLEYRDDLNEPDSAGIMSTPRNKVGRYRASAAVTYLYEARDRANLEIMADTMVTRVLFEGTNAVGVEIERKGKREKVLGDRVVLSGGAINSPQLLMLSGVGPKEMLQRFGIDVLVDLPGVGANLVDHPHVPVVFAASDPAETRFGFNASLRWSSGAPGCPDNDMILALGFTAAKNMNFDLDPDVKAGVFLPVILGKPQAGGWLEISSADANTHPELHFNFLGSDVDTQRLADGVRFAMELFRSNAMSPHVGEPLLAPDNETLADEPKFLEWIRNHVTTTYHCVGSCRMGPDGDDMAVLDSGLRVRGVSNLYVADASIMPSIVTSYTNLTCYMIGEKFADMLSEESK